MNAANIPLITAKNLKRSYEVGGGPFKKPKILKALDGASFELYAGKTLAIVGESGCGKSTLARLIAMIEEPTDGTLLINGEPANPNLPEHRKFVQIVFQNPYGSLNPRHKIGRILEEPLALSTNIEPAERTRRAHDILQRVGLRKEHYDRYPHMFSGGQRQRIAIARALMLEPRVLVLDEPVSALDLSIQAQVLNILADLQAEFNLAYLFISHDLSVVKHISDDVMVMYLGKVVESGPAKTVFSHPRHPYTEALLSATPVADPSRIKKRIMLTGELPSPLNPPQGCAFNPRCRNSTERCRAERPPLTDHGPSAFACFNPVAEMETEV